MGDFEFQLDPTFRFELDTPTLRVPRRAVRPSLGVPRLRLDPEIEAMLSLRRAGLMLSLWTVPDSSRSLEALILARLDGLGWENLFDDGEDNDDDPQPAPGTNREQEIREGRPGDLFNAIWRLPEVQDARDRVVDEVTSQLRYGWRSATVGERVLLVSHTALISGAALTAILANDQTRPQFLRLMSNVDIPVPIVDGMSFRVNPRGASFRVPLVVPGLTGQGRFSIDGDWQGMVQFDLMRFLRSRRR